MIDCATFLHDAREYCEHALPADRMAACDEHASACAACGDLLRLARETTCREVAEFLLEYVEGSLPGERRRVFDRHLGICPECLSFLDSYRTTVTSCGLLREDPVETSDAPAAGRVPDRLLLAVLRARQVPGTPETPGDAAAGE